MDINSIWYIILGVTFVAYAILDGFDLGVGTLHLFTRKDADRRAFLNSIGPVWDGNEVWLVVGIGILFGAFPNVYAVAFSGFYAIITLLLVALIFRGVAIEFRNKESWWWWRTLWDFAFALGSSVPPILFGVAIGTMVEGLPIDATGELQPMSLFACFKPYPLLVGLFVWSLFTLHGAMYLNMKTAGQLQLRVQRWARICFALFLVLYVVTTLVTVVKYPHMIAGFGERWWAIVLVVLTVLAVANVPRTLHKGYELRALLTSACVIAGTVTLFGIGLFPVLLRSSLNPSWSLTVYNSASSPGTLKIMVLMVVLGLPFVLAYTAGIYWVFRGKVNSDKDGKDGHHY